jgi:beta-xylosidase
MTALRTITATFDASAVLDAAVSVNAGGAASGSFVADAGFSGGSTYSTTSAIDTSLVPSPVPPAAVFQSERYGEFTYTFANRTPGSAQTVTLYFAESYWTAAAQRTFSVAINGANVLTAFDIFAAAGGANKAIARTFATTASTSGQVVIQFTKAGGADNPKVSGITVAAGGSGGTTYALTALKAGTGSGTVAGGAISCGSTCGATYTSGATVTLTATAASGSTFSAWSGACAGTGTCIVSMTADRTVTATFTAQVTTYGLTVTKAGTGSGTVTSSPAGISCGSTCNATYASGTSVTLSAAAGSGASFAGWSGACTGTGSCVLTMTAARSVTATFNGSRPSTYTNPVFWEDLADIDIIRVDDTYYYSASTMHYSPGAPILRSYDLVNWEYAGHSVPTLDFGSAFSLNGGRAYVKGIWASFLNYRRSNRTFYWGGCIQGGGGTFIYTATSAEGPWVKHGPLPCYYDAGMLVDDNDTMYVAYGNTTISVAQLAADGFSQVRSQQVYSTPSSIGTLEGSRFYKRNGFYYIWLTRPANGQYVLRSTSPWGPYTIQQVLLNMGTPLSGSGVPHQGGLVQTQNGDWYYMAFIDAYPGGRIPVLAPIDWVSDWPVIRTVNGAWGATYPFPNVPASPRAVKAPTGTDTFTGGALGPEWEWNHNPDDTRWSANGGLRLQTATVTNDIYQARNTLTHRILGPTSTATIVLDSSGMRDGDRAGLSLFRDLSAWIGVRRDSGATRVAFVNNINMNSSWATSSTGTEVTSAAVSGGRIWLRLAVDIRPGTGKQGRFSYSTDGVNFTQLGTYTMGNAWQFFMGYRYGIFNYATIALGGSVTVESFTLSTP